MFDFAEPNSLPEGAQTGPIHRELNETDSDSISLSSAVQEKRRFE
jgi:hypothetical protein